MRYLVITPSWYHQNPQAKLPVLYLLHPAGCTPEFWLVSGAGPHNPSLGTLIDAHRFIIVAPYDGFGFSWWLNSPLQAQKQYSTYLSTELKRRIDSRYRTLPDRSNTGLAGQSMGGFGSIHNLIEHPDIYCGAALMKPAVDLQWPLPPSWTADYGLGALLGTGQEFAENWQRFNPAANCARLAQKNAAVRIYNGKEDISFYNGALQLHKKLDSLKIPNTYIELPEPHNDCSKQLMDSVLAMYDAAFTFKIAAPEAGR
jgi:S-formylglutathione hydrolase FrmB